MFKIKNLFKPYIGNKSNIFFIIKNIQNKPLFFILLSYAITSIFLPYKFIISLFILLYIFIYLKNIHLKKTTYKDILVTIIISLSYITINYLLGFKLGFLKNPLTYNFFNIITYIIPIISIELTRFILINHNQNKIYYFLITILIIISEINFNYLFGALNNKKLLMMYLISDLIPIICNNILFTYLSLKKSYLIPILFILINNITIFLPIIPNISWLTKCMLTILELFIIYLYFKNSITKEQNNSFVIISYALTFILATLLVCFILGLFKYKPITILSNSMSPNLVRGDMIIYKTLPQDELNNLPLNSIIVFSDQNKIIVHRLIAKRQENNITYYRTKGDNNSVADSHEVTIDNIKGLYTFHIKYLGYPSIWLYEYFNE